MRKDDKQANEVFGFKQVIRIKVASVLSNSRKETA
jgi:hypothetical protein